MGVLTVCLGRGDILSAPDSWVVSVWYDCGGTSRDHLPFAAALKIMVGVLGGAGTGAFFLLYDLQQI